MALFLWAPDAWLGLGFFDAHDIRHHHIPWRTWAAQEWLNGELPLWAPIGTGFPLGADGQTGVFYPPGMIIFMIFSPSVAMNLTLLLHLGWSLLGMILFLRSLGRSDWASVLGATAFTFGGLMTTHALYVGMLCCWAWLPWGLWATSKRNYGLLVVSLTMMAVAGHPQAAVLGWLMVSVFGLYHFRVQHWSMWPFLWALLLSVGLTSPQWVSSIELSQFSLRDGGMSAESAAVGSMPIFELLSIILPYFFGYERPADILLSHWHRGELYWGAGINYWELCTYVGIPILIFSSLAYRKRFWVGVVLISLALMLGEVSPLWWVIHYIPPFSFLRFPARFSIVFVIGMCVLASIGFDRFIEFNDIQRRCMSQYLLWIFFGLILGLSMSSLVYGYVSTDLSTWLVQHYTERSLPPMPDLPPEILAAMPPPILAAPEIRTQQIIEGLQTALSVKLHWPGLVSLLVVAALVRFKVNEWLKMSFVVVLYTELFIFGANYHPRSTEPMWEKDSLSRILIEKNGIDKSDRIGTVLRHQLQELDGELLSSNMGLLYGYSDVMVPSPLRLIRQESLLSLTGLSLGSQGEGALETLKSHPHLVDLLGVRYLLSTEHLEGYHRLGGDVVGVYENEDVLPRSWVVNCVEHADSMWSALATFDPRESALIESDMDLPCEPSLGVTPVEILSDSSQAMSLRLESPQSGLVIIRDAWYPGWLAEVNGEKTSVSRVNWNFRAVPIQKGTTTIKMYYSPKWLYPVFGVVFLSLIGTALLVRRSDKVSSHAEAS